MHAEQHNMRASVFLRHGWAQSIVCATGVHLESMFQALWEAEQSGAAICGAGQTAAHALPPLPSPTVPPTGSSVHNCGVCFAFSASLQTTVKAPCTRAFAAAACRPRRPCVPSLGHVIWAMQPEPGAPRGAGPPARPVPSAGAPPGLPSHSFSPTSSFLLLPTPLSMVRGSAAPPVVRPCGALPASFASRYTKCQRCSVSALCPPFAGCLAEAAGITGAGDIGFCADAVGGGLGCRRAPRRRARPPRHRNRSGRSARSHSTRGCSWSAERQPAGC